jgi:hypothetical protein
MSLRGHRLARAEPALARLAKLGAILSRLENVVLTTLDRGCDGLYAFANLCRIDPRVAHDVLDVSPLARRDLLLRRAVVKRVRRVPVLAALS